MRFDTTVKSRCNDGEGFDSPRVRSAIEGSSIVRLNESVVKEISWFLKIWIVMGVRSEIYVEVQRVVSKYGEIFVSITSENFLWRSVTQKSPVKNLVFIGRSIDEKGAELSSWRQFKGSDWSAPAVASSAWYSCITEGYRATEKRSFCHNFQSLGWQEKVKYQARPGAVRVIESHSYLVRFLRKRQKLIRISSYPTTSRFSLHFF